MSASPRRVTILGGSGFVGRHLAAHLRGRGDDVRTVSLRDPENAAQTANGSHVVVNLSGESVAQRWSAQAKERIRASRVELPRRFLTALETVAHRPGAYVTASAVGYYGASETRTFVEDDPPGDDFLARVCAELEEVARSAGGLGMRTACVRSGVALDRTSGPLAPMIRAFRFGVGGKIGTGRQWLSWVHPADLVALYTLAIDGVDGALNATAPEPVTNAELTRALGHAFRRPTLLPTPTFVLHAMFGEGAMMALEGQRVLPHRALELGFTFRFTALDAALRDILG
jgi:uncharacterized protein (TIGR01777 family)